MASKIKLRRTPEALFPTLDDGEPGFTTDTNKFFVGTTHGNVQISGSGGGGGGSQGVTGLQGPQGATGVGGGGGGGSQGATGIQGVTGLRGLTGIGVQGATGLGAQGATGVGVQGIQGVTGPAGTGGGGGSGTSIIYNTTSRYQLVSTAGEEVWCVSSATVETGLTWSFSGGTLTVTKTGHGRSNGDTVIIRNMNVDNYAAAITVTDLNTFTCTVPTGTGTSGTSGAYSLGFGYAHDAAGASKTKGTLTAPIGGDIQLISLNVRTGPRAGTTYDIVVPQSATNGCGGNSTLSNFYLPNISVKGETLAAINATLALTTAGVYNSVRVGGFASSATSGFISYQV